MIIICGNDEMLAGKVSDFDYEVAKEAARSIDYSDLADLAGDAEYEVDTDFVNWNGGKYKHQAGKYGYRVYGLVCYQTDSEKEDAIRISDELDRLVRQRAESIAALYS